MSKKISRKFHRIFFLITQEKIELPDKNFDTTRPTGQNIQNLMVRNGLPIQVSPLSTAYFMFNSHFLGAFGSLIHKGNKI